MTGPTGQDLLWCPEDAVSFVLKDSTGALVVISHPDSGRFTLDIVTNQIFLNTSLDSSTNLKLILNLEIHASLASGDLKILQIGQIGCPTICQLTPVINPSFLSSHPEMTFHTLTNKLSIKMTKIKQATRYEVKDMISWTTDIPNCYAKTMRICVDPQC